MKKKPWQFVELIIATVNAMELPRWYSREEGYSTGFLAVNKKLHEYRIKKHRCKLQTYLATGVRGWVKNEIIKHQKSRAKTMRFSSEAWGLFEDWRTNGKEKGGQEGSEENP